MVPSVRKRSQSPKPGNNLGTEVDEASAYGSKGQTWHANFIAYMSAMVAHTAYAGMPHAVKPDGKIQWEAPSNRKGGSYQHTHRLRRDWWREKAIAIGADLNSPTWISDVAKAIHPTGEKPCKRCGETMTIAYVYPNGMLAKRLNARFGDSFVVDPLEPIGSMVQRLVAQCGSIALDYLPAILSTSEIRVPNLGRELATWQVWLGSSYVPLESSLLSPGAMSNAPDRFDGFHSFNRCCRKKADTGRHDANMRTYGTDRRVFEYWSEGDWIAADRLMGLISSRMREEPCADGGSGAPTADHIGPLSLGFMHRPEFRLLSKAANSAKNNRMTFSDVDHLRRAEIQGHEVVSWHARPLWNLRKWDVVSEETALRLSKVMRDNQRNAMYLLAVLMRDGHFAFLASLLGLHHARYDVEFEGLRAELFVTNYNRTVKTDRSTLYVAEQQARRLRVAFAALASYDAKDNRHAFVLEDTRVAAHIDAASRILDGVSHDVADLNETLLQLVTQPSPNEHLLREAAGLVPTSQNSTFSRAQAELLKAMECIAERISSMWNTDRYVRGPFDFMAD